MFEANLIALYSYICERYDSELQYECERFSNNSHIPPVFTDQEAITVYLYGVHYENRFKIKDIYRFTKTHLLSFFPKLPSYQAFNARMNRMCTVFQKLSALILEDPQNIPPDLDQAPILTDSMPIITCSGKRRGKVAPEITAKGLCSTKNLYYYGLKLHLNAVRRKGTLPYPLHLTLTDAAANDLTLFKEVDYNRNYQNLSFFADKAYCDGPYFTGLADTQNTQMNTPVKLIKGENEWTRMHQKAGRDTFSRAVSSVRQSIESSFNWLIEHTDIQRASKVRSTKGLLTHVFGKIAAAFYKPIPNVFNP